MATFLIQLLLTALVVLVIAWIIPKIKIKGFIPAILVSLLIAAVAIYIKPFILGILPNMSNNDLIFLIIEFVVNSILVLLISLIVPGFSVKSFWSALLFSLLLVLFNNLFPYHIFDF